MHCIIALPCLNEGIGFLPTCASLGFAAGQVPPSNAVLVLVDNGSDDDTWAHMVELQRTTAAGAVSAVQEQNRGYIAARRAGAAEAVRIAAERGWAADDVLLLQADADTIYGPGYLNAMRSCAERSPCNRLFEGRSEAPEDPHDPVAQMQAAEQAADAEVADRFAPDELDIIVDDKVAAFRLSDYFAWGEHQREFDRSGEEILAETTRLYMRARFKGAQRVRVEGAEARTSTRRILDSPDIAFATAGFPYPPAWKERWRQRYRGPRELEAFASWPLPEGTALALDERRRHVLAIFTFAPALSEEAVASGGPHAQHAPNPGRLLENAFELAAKDASS